ncbi:MAG: hypothetical protein ACP5HQ_00330 [Thermoprotei archaeon]
MNKALGLALVSLFFLSLIVGLVPITTTVNAASGSPQTYIVPLELPYVFAVVVTNVNLGTPAASGVIAQELNETFEATKLTVSLSNVSYSNSVIVNGNLTKVTSPSKLGYYYSPAAQAVVLIYGLDATEGYSYSAAKLINQVYLATGINLVNQTYPYLVNASGKFVYTNQTVNVITADVLTFNNGTGYYTLNQWTGYGLLITPTKLQQYSITAQVTVSPVVFAPTQINAPSKNAVLFAPITITKIYNQMMNNQPVGWGRSLINVTVYNPLGSSTTLYLYQLNFTGPGPVTVYFYRAVDIYSADQLAQLKPTVGAFNFTGSRTVNSSFLLGYTIVILTVQGNNKPTIQEIFPTGRLPGSTQGSQIPSYALVGTYTSTLNTTNIMNVSAFGLTFVYINGPVRDVIGLSPMYNISVPLTYNNSKATFAYIPVYPVYINGTTTKLNITNLYWYNATTKALVQEPSVLLPVKPHLNPTPIPITTTIATTSYEEFPASAYTPAGNNNYNGMLFTTPPGSNGLQMLFTLTGNDTIKQYTANSYVNVFGTFSFLNIPHGYDYESDWISVQGTLVTPAYPYLNGSALTGIIINTEVMTKKIGGIPYTYVFTNGTPVTVTNIEYVTGQGIVVNVTNTTKLSSGGSSNGIFSNLPLIYAQIVQNSHLPAVQQISPTTLPATLSVNPKLFYQALVTLGLWTNQTIVYVKGAAYISDNNEWYPMYGTSYFRALIIPPSLTVSSVTPNSLTCNNAIWANFRSPDDVLDTGYYNGIYALNVTPILAANVFGMKYVSGAALNTTAAFKFYNNITTKSQGYFVGGTYLNASTSNATYAIDNYLGLSNYTIQSNVPGGMSISVTLPNGVPVNWTLAPGVYQVNNNYYAYAPVILPTPAPNSAVPTPNFNVTLYVRYQFDYGIGANGATINPGIYYGPANTLVVVLPPNMTVGTRITLTFTAGDFAVQYLFPKNYWQLSTTVVIPNATLTVNAPKFVPLYELNVPVQIIEPYYAAPYPAQLAIGTNSVTLVANSYTLFGASAKPYAVGVGKIVSMSVVFPNGTREKVYLTGTNVTTLFQSGVFNENGSCTGAYNAVLSVQGLLKVLNLSSVSQLDGSCLYVTYYDNITHATATAKICFGGVSAISPVAVKPAAIFYVLTAKYVNATAGMPVALAQSVAVQPMISLNDTFLAKAQAGVVANLQVTNVTIVDHYGNKYYVYYNATNKSTNVMINGKISKALPDNLLPTIPETTPNSGIFNGTPITLVISKPGALYQNGTVCNGTLAVKLGNNVVTLGPATNFALPVYSFAGKIYGYNSTMYVTVKDPATMSTLTLKTYITAYNITPIRIAPVTTPVPWPNANKAVEVVNTTYVLTPTNQYIVIHVTSIINYTYVFYIATVVQAGKAATAGTPVLVNFQTVVPVPVIGPGVVAQVPVQFSQIGALSTGYYTVTMFAVPFAGGPVISLYPAEIVFTNVFINTTVV